MTFSELAFTANSKSRCHFTAVISVITEITYFFQPWVQITLLFKPDLVVAQNTAQSTISKIAESSYVKIVPDSDILDKSLFLLCVELCVGKRRSRLLDAEVDF